LIEPAAMDDAAAAAAVLRPPPARQRAEGRVRVGWSARSGMTRLSDLYQSGAAKARCPRVYGGAPAEAVLINTAGGLCDGDRLSVAVTAARGAHAAVTTQACERVYRAASPAFADVDAHLSIDDGARLDWLPQETIVFDGARLRRRLRVDMADGARLLAVETLVLGRAAMGETVRAAALRDGWRVRRGGRLIYADDLRLDGPGTDAACGAGLLAGRTVVSQILFAAPDAEASSRLDAVRALIDAAPDVCAGASAFDGLLSVRAAAFDGKSLRALWSPVLATLRDGAPLPRVWTT
jgi:urease accessory protein